MLLDTFQIVDLFFRFAAVGVLLSLLLNCFCYHTESKFAWSYGFLLICCIAYLLLTAPIDNQHYGWLRPPLLLFTDLTSLALLNLYWLHTRNQLLLSALPRWLQVLVIFWLLWTTYFFLIEAGKGLYHDINHALGLSILVYILIDATKGLGDDLIEGRRRLRLIMITAISFYMVLLTLIELSQSNIKDHWLFSIGNAATALLVSVYFTFGYIRGARRTLAEFTNSKQETAATTKIATPSEWHPLVAKLTKVMQDGFYTQHNASIGQLASELKVPPHQLRRTINGEMGFDNFSQFINSYRIPAICDALSDPSRARDPILTLALEAGFNSIAPFNRAFKQKMGMTPREYRDQF